MQLWNVRTKFVPKPSNQLTNTHISRSARTCIHTFSLSRLLTQLPDGDPNHPTCAITALTQSPAIDVVGIGFTSGEISVYDVRADERLLRMFMEGGGIRALSFRSGLYIFHFAICDLTATLLIRWASNPCNCIFNREYLHLGLKLKWAPPPYHTGST